jgi:hypothetical protein
MKWQVILLGLALVVFGAVGPAAEPLRVLCVGNNRDRAADYESFLKQHFAKVTVVRRDGFDAAAARDADVILLDWSQSEGQVDKAKSPFGKFEDWSKPTVLLGSAGLFMAGQSIGRMPIPLRSHLNPRQFYLRSKQNRFS